MKLLEGKVALITGAARGIGKAIALKYASEGASVAFTDLEINETAQETVAQLEAFGVAVKAYASNAAEFEATQAVGYGKHHDEGAEHDEGGLLGAHEVDVGCFERFSDDIAESEQHQET